jgi:hypothetical protein
MCTAFGSRISAVPNGFQAEPPASSNANNSNNYESTEQDQNMNNRVRFLFLLATTLLVSGCGKGDLASHKPAKTAVADTAAEPDALQEKTEARHAVRFVHQFPDGGAGGVTSVPVAGQPFYGFHGENYRSSTGSEGTFTEVNFQFRLLDHRDGKDIYEVIRTVFRKTEQVGSVTSKKYRPAEDLRRQICR